MNAKVLIKNGTVYDGLGSPPANVDIVIEDGKVSAIGKQLSSEGAEIIDAEGQWVMPGFVDIHTHYDAEIEKHPGLEESVKHGVTTVVMGNCSLSLAMGDPEDVVDMFARVENLPKELLREWVGDKMDWRTPAEYYEHLNSLSLGPNIASFLGHSNLRLAALGKERCLKREKISKQDKLKMTQYLDEALEAGYLGMSIDMLPWHRWMGYKYNGASIPSQFAYMDEYRCLADVLRKRGRVLQATPNANRKESALLLGLLSRGITRRPLKLTMLAALDFKGNRAMGKLPNVLTQLVNRVLQGDLRFQSLACPFELWSDGYCTPIFEEFHSGSMLMNADTQEQRNQLFNDHAWRKQFRKEWLAVLNRSFHRDLADMMVIDCPEPTLVGKNFVEIAQAKKQDPIECFLDLLAEYDQQIRWHAVVANDRPDVLRKILNQPFNQVGFSDAGAHNRNLGFQNAHLCLLRDAKKYSEGLSVEHAIHKLTGDVAQWLGLDAGVLKVGKRADVVVINPDALETDLTSASLIKDTRFNDGFRMTTGSGHVVQKVFIGGESVFTSGSFVEEYGTRSFGRLLKSELH